MGLALSLALGGGGFLTLAVIGIVVLGGWPLLLNRRVLMGLAIAAAVIAAAVWLDRAREGLIEQGATEERARWVEANARAHKERQDEISSYVVASSERQVAALEQLRLTRQRIELALLELERNSHVTAAADARCDLTHGFVLDHDAALSVAAGRAAISDGKAADVDRSAGVALSLAAREIRANYGALGACRAELNAIEDRRYTECLEYDRKYATKSGCARGGPQEAPTNAGRPETTKGR